MFRGLIDHLENNGNEVLIIARDKDVALDLLEYYGITFKRIGRQSSGAGLAREWMGRYVGVLREARSFNPDVLIGESNPLVAQIGRLMGKRSIVFLDTEHALLQNSLTLPAADVICTPECYPDDLGPGQVTYRGFKELIYLHPRHFSPDPGALEEVGLSRGERFSLVRTVSWSAAHDVGHGGLGCILTEIVEALEMYGTVLISSEGSLPASCSKYAIKAPPAKIHDIISQADLYLGDGASMAAEAAVLGIPSVFASSLRLRYLDVLARVYRLAYQVDISEAIGTAKVLLDNPMTREKWNSRRAFLLQDTVDMSDFLIDLVGRVSAEI